MKNNKFSSLISVVNVSVILFAVVFSAVTISYSQHMMQDTLRQRQSAQYISALEKMSSLRAKLEGTINSSMALLKGSASYIASNPEANQQEFAKFVSSLIEGHSQIRNVGAAPNLVIRLMHPLKGNEKAIGLDYRKIKSQHGAAVRAMKSHKMSLAGPINLVQGGTGFIGRVPVFIGEDNDQFWGLVSGVIDVPSVYRIAGISNPELGLNLKIQGIDGLGQNGLIFYGRENELDKNPISLKVTVPNGEWVLSATPKDGWISHHPDSRLYFFVTAAAVLTLIILSFIIIYFLQRRAKDQQEIFESKQLLRVIDERNQAMEELNKNLMQIDLQERRFRSMFNAISDGIILTDTDRRIIAANKGMLSTFGYEEIELLGNKTSMLYESVVEFERQGQLRFNLSPKELSEPYTALYRHKDGHIFLAETLGTVVKNEDGEIVSFLGVMRDITERTEMEQAVRQSQKMDAVGNLAGGIAHDVNNMLLPIITLSGMTAKDLPEGSREQKRLEKVVEAGVKAKNLIAGILAFSHREDGSVNATEVNFADVVQGSIDLIRSTVPSTISISEKLDPDTGSVLCDPSQISTILMNLASNTIDAMEGHVGRFDISVSAVNVTGQLAHKVSQLKTGRYAKLTVSDTGSGMDSETLLHLYDPFFTTKEVGDGTGLGLAMVYGIIGKHGGAIDVTSEIGVGTTFDIYLPIVEKKE